MIEPAWSGGEKCAAALFRLGRTLGVTIEFKITRVHR
jgi:hypothetical protein